MGTEIGRLGGYGFRGTVTAGDGSNRKGGKMGAGHVNLRKQRKRQQRKVGREEEGSSSNRSELAAFVLALRGTPVTKSMLYLCVGFPNYVELIDPTFRDAGGVD